ncbi:ATP phosphoribosyltransferase regulatory subunit, partial [archaeon]|nr:ATP phosphoribosyltransferase regulatory subunit [archaeon]
TKESYNTKYLVVPTNAGLIKKAIEISTIIREKSPCEVDLMRRKLGKALSYADAEGIPFVVIVGKEELKNDRVLLKNMKSGEQKEVSVKDL